MVAFMLWLIYMWSDGCPCIKLAGIIRELCQEKYIRRPIVNLIYRQLKQVSTVCKSIFTIRGQNMGPSI